MESWIDVAAASRFPPGEFQTVDLDGREVAVFNVGGEYFAIEDLCTHDGGTLAGGAVDGEEVICPRHGARFSLRTGAALSPPAYEPVKTFAVRVFDGIVQVRSD